MSRPQKLDEVRRLEELAFRGWPALESRDLAGWRLRFSKGYTKRANSINPLGVDAQCTSEVVSALEAPYLGLGQTPTWRLTPLAPSAIGPLLAGRGYRSIEQSLLQVIHEYRPPLRRGSCLLAAARRALLPCVRSPAASDPSTHLIPGRLR